MYILLQSCFDLAIFLPAVDHVSAEINTWLVILSNI